MVGRLWKSQPSTPSVTDMVAELKKAKELNLVIQRPPLTKVPRFYSCPA